MRFSTIVAAIFCLGIFFSPHSAHAENHLTIYSSIRPGQVHPSLFRPSHSGIGWNTIPGYAMVRDVRPTELKTGPQDLYFQDVAALIDPTTVKVRVLDKKTAVQVLDQDYLFDLVNRDALFSRYVDQDITLETLRGDSIDTVTGTLLSYRDGITLLTEDQQVLVVNQYANVRFPSLPGGLRTRPTLKWNLLTDHTGTVPLEVSYQTEGITWWADYNATFREGRNANQGILDLNAWVTIINKSGASFNDTGLKLVAGDVQKIQPPGNHRFMRHGMTMQAVGIADVAGFEEKAFFEYHLYTLGRKVNLPQNSTKQLELFPAVANIPVEKIYLYDGTVGRYYGGGVNTNKDFGVQSNTKVAVYLQLENSETAGLGVPLPAGRVRVSQQDDADGSLEFVGEDIIDHTPRDEKIRLKLGNAFDVVGERKQIHFHIDHARNTMTETIQITLRNRKENDAIHVLVKESFPRAQNWQIQDHTGTYEKLDSQTVHFPVNIPAGKERNVRYTVKYHW